VTVSDAGGGAAALALKTHEQRRDCSQPNADREAPGVDGNVRYSEPLFCY
jgi:hypothetical protein